MTLHLWRDEKHRDIRKEVLSMLKAKDVAEYFLSKDLNRSIFNKKLIQKMDMNFMTVTLV